MPPAAFGKEPANAMRIIVMSDSHTAFGRVYTIVERTWQEADLYVHLGDGEEEYLEVAALFPGKKFLHVRGNNDYLSAAPQEITFDADGVTVLCTHGDRYAVRWNRDYLLAAAKKKGARVALYGHSHEALCEYLDDIYLINPGSVADSRLTPAGYLVLDITPQGIVPIQRRIEPSPEEYR